MFEINQKAMKDIRFPRCFYSCDQALLNVTQATKLLKDNLRPLNGKAKFAYM